MRDVDYLLAAHISGPPPLERTLIYRYRSGLLRPRMLSVLCAIAEMHNKRLTNGSLPLYAGFAEGGMFDSLMFYNWPARAGRALNASALEDSLAILAASARQPSVHLVPYDSAITAYRGWRAVEQACLIVEEPVITRESLLPVLRYLTATTDLARDADFLVQPGFAASFGNLVEERADLPAVIQAFDERVLLCTNPATNQFDPSLYRRDVVHRSGRRAPLLHLRDLMALRRENDLVDLVCAFDERRSERGWTAFELVAELYRITGRLLDPAPGSDRVRSSPRSRVTVGRALEEAFLWAALVLADERGLGRSVREERDGYRRGPDQFVTALASLGRDFLGCASRAEADDPLAGQWAGLARALGRSSAGHPEDCLATARGNPIQALAAALDQRPGGMPNWIGRLHAETLAAVAPVEPSPSRIARRLEMKPAAVKDDQTLPQTFEAVIGRVHAVQALRRHARGRDAGVDLLLYGPDGVGKRTLAWLYARAVLCDTPQPGGSPCGACAPCRSFDNGSPGYAEADGDSADVEAHTEQIVEAIKASMFRDRCVVAIRNADSYPPALFDALLRPMEDKGRVSFVLLARDRNGVRLAGRSRCFDCRVRPLDISEAETFLRDILAARGLVCDDATLALLIDASGGLPGRLHEACRVVAGTMPLSLAATRAKLGLDWAEVSISLWPEIVARAPSALSNMMPSSGISRTEQVRRVRVLLQYVYLCGLRGASTDLDAIDPALRHLNDQLRTKLVAALKQQAARDSRTPEIAWCEMAKTWLNEI